MEKVEEVGKGEWEAEELHSPNQTKKGERNYADEAPAFPNLLKLLINLWRALMSALDTEFKSSKKSLLKVLNLNLLRALGSYRGGALHSAYPHRNMSRNSQGLGL